MAGCFLRDDLISFRLVSLSFVITANNCSVVSLMQVDSLLNSYSRCLVELREPHMCVRDAAHKTMNIPQMTYAHIANV